MTESLDSLLAYCKANGRVCPLPRQWSKLWELLPNRKSVGSGWEPAAPLILAAWHVPGLMKMMRLQEHIEWADKHGALELVGSYLRGLAETDWYHLSD
jgi:hypothetical protein